MGFRTSGTKRLICLIGVRSIRVQGPLTFQGHLVPKVGIILFGCGVKV